MYDGDGNRVKKTLQSGTATEYFYADGTLYKEKFGVDTILFYRDEDGKICSIMYDSAPYILRKNAQGDVIALCDSKGEVVARYVYDAWGNHKVLNPDGTENTSAGFIGNINPIRYRGYYYDKDLGLYWLKTRFYDPQTGRFISPDSVEYLDPETLGGINLYAYCNNNPVMNVDPNGTAFLSILVGLGIAALVGATVGGASYAASEVISYSITGKWTWSWGMFTGNVLGGAIGGMISFIAPGVGAVGGAVITGGLSQFLGMEFQMAFHEANYSTGQLVFETLKTAAISAGSAWLTSKIDISGFTGRGSVTQVANQINTKLRRGVIKSVTAKTLGKMFVYNIVYSILNTIYSGLNDAVPEWKRSRPIYPVYPGKIMQG